MYIFVKNLENRPTKRRFRIFCHFIIAIRWFFCLKILLCLAQQIHNGCRIVDNSFDQSCCVVAVGSMHKFISNIIIAPCQYLIVLFIYFFYCFFFIDFRLNRGDSFIHSFVCRLRTI